MEILKGLFVKLTCTINWEDAKSKYPVFAVEDRLTTFYQLNFKGGIPTVFKDYCSSALTSKMQSNTANIHVSFEKGDTHVHVMQSSYLTTSGQCIKKTLPTSNGYSLVFAFLPEAHKIYVHELCANVHTAKVNVKCNYVRICMYVYKCKM